jgi:membrane-associated PAP2 superfamily phosphatase
MLSSEHAITSTARLANAPRGHATFLAWRVPPRFHRQHLWWPLAGFALLSFVLMGLRGDQWLADALYAWEGNAWSLQSGHFTQDVLHAGGRQFVKYLWVGVLLAFLVSLARRSKAAWRWPLAYLLVSTVLATMLVGVMKRWTHVDCPWDLLRYGGGKAYYGLFSTRPVGVRSSGCFPAGHASAGYAWVALYFFLLATRPRWRWWGLGVGMLLGLLFGFAQQLRGAHFLSHDLWALMVSWLSALALYRWMLVPRQHGLAGAASA